ncbi:MAG: hypothetical protein ACO3C1_11075 [Ilumatobacteraceae bacterium]
MTVASIALAVHVVGTAFMCGLNWLVQSVHYPLFLFAEGDRWGEFHAEHSRRIAAVVGLPWAMQGLGVFALLVSRPERLGMGLVLAALVLAGVTVVATVLFALPAHAQLSTGFSAAAHRRLVVTNWVRTVAWTCGALVAIAMVVQALDA